MGQKWNRIKSIFGAKVNTAIENEEKKDPIGIMKNEYRKAQEELGEYEGAMKRFSAQIIMLNKQLTEKRESAEDWREKASIAKSAGNMELAEKAAIRCAEFTEDIEVLEEQTAKLQTQHDAKRDQFDRKRDEIKKVGEMIKAKEVAFDVAKASNELDAKTTANGGTTAMDKISDMANVVDQEVALSEASTDLAETDETKTAREFEELEKRRKAQSILDSI